MNLQTKQTIKSYAKTAGKYSLAGAIVAGRLINNVAGKTMDVVGNIATSEAGKSLAAIGATVGVVAALGGATILTAAALKYV